MKRPKRWGAACIALGASALLALSIMTAPASAAEPDAYTPTGPLVADSGFRPAPDGFAFQNYGKGQPGLTAAEMRQLFGDEVCANAPSDTCELTPPAKAWMDTENKGMDGGHCYGFAVAAMRFHAKQLSPSAFGELSVPRFKLTTPVARMIAYHFVHQALASVKAKTLTGSPEEIVDELGEELPRGREQYTIGLYKAIRDKDGKLIDVEDGHAITPFAIERKGPDRFAILVYDNNFPGKFRDVQVDTEKNTWTFDGAPNPSVDSDLYEGDAETETLQLLPVSPGLGKQPCPFCNGTQNAALTRPGGRAIEVSLEGDLRRHAHLLIRDRRSRLLGYKGKRLVRTIPGGEATRLVEAGAGRKMRREPRYRVPAGRSYTITLDNTRTKARDVEGMQITGPGWLAHVRNIRLKGGERVSLSISPDGREISFRSNRRIAAPEVSVGLQEKGADHAFTLIRSSGLVPGRRVKLSLDPDDGKLAIDGPDGVYDVLMRYVDLSGEKVFARRDVDTASATDGDEGEVRIGYGAWNGDASDDLTLAGDRGGARELSSEASPGSDPDEVQDDLSAGRDPE